MAFDYRIRFNQNELLCLTYSGSNLCDRDLWVLIGKSGKTIKWRAFEIVMSDMAEINKRIANKYEIGERINGGTFGEIYAVTIAGEQQRDLE